MNRLAGAAAAERLEPSDKQNKLQTKRRCCQPPKRISEQKIDLIVPAGLGSGKEAIPRSRSTSKADIRAQDRPHCSGRPRKRKRGHSAHKIDLIVVVVAGLGSGKEVISAIKIDLIVPADLGSGKEAIPRTRSTSSLWTASVVIPAK